MPQFNPPGEFLFDKPEEWPGWKQRFQHYRIASKLDKEQPFRQVSSLIYSMGAEAEKVFLSFGLSTTPAVLAPAAAEGQPEVPAEADNFDIVLQKFDDYFIPKRNIIYERAKFHQRVQHVGESAQSFYRSLTELADTCDFVNKDEEIWDRLVIGILDKEISVELQSKADLTLKHAVDRIRSSEMLKGQNKVDTVPRVDQVSGQCTKGGRPNKHGMGKRCGNCNLFLDHRHKECPAKGQQCNKCRKIGHYARCCRSQMGTRSNESYRDSHSHHGGSSHRGRKTQSRGRQVHEVSEGPDSQFLGFVTCKSCDDADWYVDLDVNGNTLNFKLDTGADVTVISRSTFMSMSNRPRLRRSSITLKSPGGDLQNEGQFLARTSYIGKAYHFLFQVVSNDVTTFARSKRLCQVRLSCSNPCYIISGWSQSETKHRAVKMCACKNQSKSRCSTIFCRHHASCSHSPPG